MNPMNDMTGAQRAVVWAAILVALIFTIFNLIIYPLLAF
jgi:hypothetical protein